VVAGNMVTAKSRGWVMHMREAIMAIQSEKDRTTAAAVIAAAIVDAEVITEVALDLGLCRGVLSVRKR